jgi:hypothetical protein
VSKKIQIKEEMTQGKLISSIKSTSLEILGKFYIKQNVNGNVK